MPLHWVDCEHPGGRHRVACHVLGQAGRPAVLCVHGLSRNAHDFDALAQRLAPRFRVVSVDMPGRGDSEWLQDPTHYRETTYLGDLRRVMDALELEPVRWVGTSMGGLLGMKMAAADPARVAALVLNDIGAELDGPELARLRQQSSEPVTFASRDEAETWFRSRYAAFGIQDAERWRQFTDTGIEPAPDGGLRPRFDARAASLLPVPPRVDLWATYEAIRCPVYLLRGADSVLLGRATCEAMARRGPRAQWMEVPDAGHAPDLQGVLVEAVASFIEDKEVHA